MRAFRAPRRIPISCHAPRGCSAQFPGRSPEARRPTSGDPLALFFRLVSNREGGGTRDATIKQFISGCFSYSSFGQRTTFVNKRGKSVRGWLNVRHFARLRLVVLNEVIARKSWFGDDGSGDSHGDCRKYDVSKAHVISPRIDGSVTHGQFRLCPTWLDWLLRYRRVAANIPLCLASAVPRRRPVLLRPVGQLELPIF